MPRLDAVAVSSTDLARSADFYRILGFKFDEFTPEDQHIEAVTHPGGTRLMIDAAALMTSLIGAPPKPANHAGFALKFEDAAGVDAAASAIAAAGFDVVRDPWDAFWGQRYAVVRDPDGYQTDLFADL